MNRWQIFVKKQNKLQNVFNNYATIILEWLTMFYLPPYNHDIQNDRHICANYYTENVISSPVTMQIAYVKCGFAGFVEQGI